MQVCGGARSVTAPHLSPLVPDSALVRERGLYGSELKIERSDTDGGRGEDRFLIPREKR